MKKQVFIIISVILLAYACGNDRKSNSVHDKNILNTEQELGVLFRGVESIDFRPGYDTTHLVYCFTFKNGERCIISIRSDANIGYYCKITDDCIDSVHYLLNEECGAFKDKYGCDVTQIYAIIQFCRRNKIDHARYYNEHHITFHSYQSLYFYSKDSLFFVKDKYEKIGENWYRPKSEIE